MDSLTEDNEKDPKVLKWKLFNRCYGYNDGVGIDFNFSTWPELPVEFGSLDLHFVELCVNSPALYKTGKSRPINASITAFALDALTGLNHNTNFIFQILCIGSIVNIHLGLLMLTGVDAPSMMA